MQKFKIGDKIKCINAYKPSLTEGKVYTVIDFFHGLPMIHSDGLTITAVLPGHFKNLSLSQIRKRKLC